MSLAAMGVARVIYALSTFPANCRQWLTTQVSVFLLTLMSTLWFVAAFAWEGSPYRAFTAVANCGKVMRLFLPVRRPFCYWLVPSREGKCVLQDGAPFVKGSQLQALQRSFFGEGILNLDDATEQDRAELKRQQDAVHTLLRSCRLHLAFTFDAPVETFLTGLAKGQCDVVPLAKRLMFDFMLGLVFESTLAAEGMENFKDSVDELLRATGLFLATKGTEADVEAAARVCDEHIVRIAGTDCNVVVLRNLALAGYATLASLLGTTLRFLGEEKGLDFQRKEVTVGANIQKVAERAVRASGAVIPPVPVVQKVAVCDIWLAGRLVRAGETVIVALSGKQEWDPETKSGLLFSEGPRRCPGAPRAMQFLTRVVGEVLESHEVHLVSKRLLKDAMLDGHESVVVRVEERVPVTTASSRTHPVGSKPLADRASLLSIVATIAFISGPLLMFVCAAYQATGHAPPAYCLLC